MCSFVNYFSQSFYKTNSTLTPPPSPPISTPTSYECKICKASYKSKSELMRHETIV